MTGFVHHHEVQGEKKREHAYIYYLSMDFMLQVGHPFGACDCMKT